MEDSSSIFMERLNAAMKAKGYSKAALARETGLSAAAIGNYVNGRMPRGCIEIVRLARALETTPNYLLGFSDNPNEQHSDCYDFATYADVYRGLHGLLFAFINRANLLVLQDESGSHSPYGVRLEIRDEKLTNYFEMAERIDRFIVDMPESYEKLTADFYARMHADKLNIPELPF